MDTQEHQIYLDITPDGTHSRVYIDGDQCLDVTSLVLVVKPGHATKLEIEFLDRAGMRQYHLVRHYVLSGTWLPDASESPDMAMVEELRAKPGSRVA